MTELQTDLQISDEILGLIALVIFILRQVLAWSKKNDPK